MIVELRFRRGTAAEWSAVNPVLGAGEPGLDLTTNRFKLGDSVKAWNDLPFQSYDLEQLNTLLNQTVDAADRAEAAAADAGGSVSGVSTVNGASGAVLITAEDLTDGTTKKMMLATERTKLAGIAAGATANASDVALRDRSTHTGQQPSTTISDLVEVVQDLVAAMFIPGTNVTLAYNDATGTITVNSTGGGGSGTVAPGTMARVEWSGTAWVYNGLVVTARPSASTAITYVFVDRVGGATLPTWALDDIDLALQKQVA